MAARPPRGSTSSANAGASGAGAPGGGGLRIGKPGAASRVSGGGPTVLRSGVGGPSGKSGSVEASLSTGTSNTWIASLLHAVFSVVHVLNETHKPAARSAGLARWAHVIMTVLDFLSLIQLIISVPLGWPSEYAHTAFSPLPWLIPEGNPGAFYALFTITQLVLWSTLLTAIYVAWSFQRGTFVSFAPAMYMRAVTGVVVTALYIPAIDVLLLPLRCDRLMLHTDSHFHGDNNATVEGPCGTSTGVALAAAAALALVAFAPFAALTTLLYVDAHPLSHSWFAARSGRDGFTDTAVRTLVTVLAFFVADTEPRAVAAIFVCMLGVLLWHTVRDLPFFHMRMNALRASMYAAATWLALGSLVLSSQLRAGADDATRTSTAQVFVGMVPLPLIVGAMVPFLRRWLLQRRLAKLLRAGHFSTETVLTVDDRDPAALATTPAPAPGSSEGAHQAEHDLVYVGDGIQANGSALRLFSGGVEMVALMAFLAIHQRRPDVTASVQRSNEDSGMFHRDALLRAEAIFEAGMLAFRDDAHVRVAYAHFLAAFRRDALRAMAMLGAAAKCPSASLDDRFAVFSFGKALDQQRQSNDLGEGRTVDGLGLAAFNQTYMAALRAHADAAAALGDMWSTVASRAGDMTAAELTHMVGQAVGARAKAQNSYALLARKYPNSARVLRTYAAFMRDVMNDPAGAMSLIDRAEALENPHGTPEEETDARSSHGGSTANRRGSNGTVGSGPARSAHSASQRSTGSSGSSGSASARRGRRIGNIGQLTVDSMRGGVRWGMLAMAAVAAGTFVAGYIALTRFDEAASDVNESGLRRALTMQVALLSREVSLTADPANGDASQLLATRNVLLGALQDLSARVSSLYTPSKLFPEARQLYDQPAFAARSYTPGPPPAWTNETLGLQDMAMSFLAQAAAVAHAPALDVVPVRVNTFPPFAFVMQNAETTFQGFAQAVVIYSIHAQEQASVFYGAAAAMLGVAAIVTLLQWCFAFMPSVRRVNSNNAAIVTIARAVPSHAAKRLARRFERLEQSLDAMCDEAAGHEADEQDLGDDAGSSSDSGEDAPLDKAATIASPAPSTPAASPTATDASTPQTVTPQSASRAAGAQPVLTTEPVVTTSRTLTTEICEVQAVSARANEEQRDGSGGVTDLLHIKPPMPSAFRRGPTVRRNLDLAQQAAVDLAGVLRVETSDCELPGAVDIVHVAGGSLTYHTGVGADAPHLRTDVVMGECQQPAFGTADLTEEPVPGTENSRSGIGEPGLMLTQATVDSVPTAAEAAAIAFGEPPLKALSASGDPTASVAASRYAASAKPSAMSRGRKHKRRVVVSTVHESTLGRSAVDAKPDLSPHHESGVGRRRRILRKFGQAVVRVCKDQTHMSDLSPLIKRMAMQFGLALFVILTLQAVAFALTYTAIDDAKSRSNAVNVAGFQRGLTQRIGMLARELAIQDGAMATPQVLVRRLRASISNFNAYQRALLYGDNALDVDSTQGSSSDLDGVYVGPSSDAFVVMNSSWYQAQRAFGMQGLTKHFLAAAETVAARYEPYYGPAAYLPASGAPVLGANYTAIISDPTLKLLRDFEREDGLLFSTIARAMDILIAQIKSVNASAVTTQVAILCVNELLLVGLWFAVFRRLFAQLREEAARTDDFKGMVPAAVAESHAKLQAALVGNDLSGTATPGADGDTPAASAP